VSPFLFQINMDKRIKININGNGNDERFLAEVKREEAKKKLVRVKIPKGYVMTTNPEKWEAYRFNPLLSGIY